MLLFHVLDERRNCDGTVARLTGEVEKKQLGAPNYMYNLSSTTLGVGICCLVHKYIGELGVVKDGTKQDEEKKTSKNEKIELDTTKMNIMRGRRRDKNSRKVG